MGFVKFTESARSYKSRISVRVNGTIGFTSGAVKKFELRSYKSAILFYDKDTRSVGIKPTKEEKDEPGAHPINMGKTGAWISCRRFFDFFGISPTTTKRYDARWDDSNKMIVFQISE